MIPAIAPYLFTIFTGTVTVCEQGSCSTVTITRGDYGECAAAAWSLIDRAVELRDAEPELGIYITHDNPPCRPEYAKEEGPTE